MHPGSVVFTGQADIFRLRLFPVVSEVFPLSVWTSFCLVNKMLGKSYAAVRNIVFFSFSVEAVCLHLDVLFNWSVPLHVSIEFTHWFPLHGFCPSLMEEKPYVTLS